jgi:hypothetical protein
MRGQFNSTCVVVGCSMDCRDDIRDCCCGQRTRSVCRRFDVFAIRQILQDFQFGVVNGFNAAIHRAVDAKSDSRQNESHGQHNAKARQVGEPSRNLARLCLRTAHSIALREIARQGRSD